MEWLICFLKWRIRSSIPLLRFFNWPRRFFKWLFHFFILPFHLFISLLHFFPLPFHFVPQLSRLFILLFHLFIRLSYLFILLSCLFIRLSRLFILLSYLFTRLSHLFILLSCFFISLSHFFPQPLLCGVTTLRCGVSPARFTFFALRFSAWDAFHAARGDFRDVHSLSYWNLLRCSRCTSTFGRYEQCENVVGDGTAENECGFYRLRSLHLSPSRELPA